MFCTLCPIVKDGKSALKICDFEMEFIKDEIKLTIEDVVTNVKYVWDNSTQSISFEYKDKKYKFTVLMTGDPKSNILKDENGRLITLSKK